MAGWKSHINIKCRTAMYNLQWIQNIRRVLSVGACKTLVHGLVTSHLDYVNGLYCGLPDSDTRKHQWVQNAAARVCNREYPRRKYTYVPKGTALAPN